MKSIEEELMPYGGLLTDRPVAPAAAPSSSAGSNGERRASKRPAEEELENGLYGILVCVI